MNREIKFRAFNKTTNKFMSLKYCIELDHHGIYPYKRVDGAKIALMQSTGLKDKNGVEIYEGDLLKDKRVVVFDTLYSRFGMANYDINARPNWVWGDGFSLDIELEVIGNIYQNPELLN